MKKTQKNKWDTIPAQCEYEGKTYLILDIDLQGGFFTLYNPEAQKGEIQVLDQIDMEKCNPKIIKDEPYFVYFKDSTGLERIGLAEKFSSNMLLVRENSFCKSLIRKIDCTPIQP